MSCLAASIPKVHVPALDALIPKVQIGPPIPGLNLCCNFWSPIDTSTTIPIGLILGLLGPALAPVIAVIVQQQATLNAYLDLLQFSFSCPLD